MMQDLHSRVEDRKDVLLQAVERQRKSLVHGFRRVVVVVLFLVSLPSLLPTSPLALHLIVVAVSVSSTRQSKLDEGGARRRRRGGVGSVPNSL
jgi:hypothetical protein